MFTIVKVHLFSVHIKIISLAPANITMPRPKRLGPPACDICGREFTTAAAKSRHKKRGCDGRVPDATALLKAEVERLRQENSFLKAENVSLKACNGQQSVSVVGSNNIVLNDARSFHITINNFHHEKTDYLTHEDVRKLITEEDHGDALQKLLVKTHFNADHPENMNIYVLNEDQVLFLLKQHWKQYEMHEAAWRIVLKIGATMNEHMDDPFFSEYSKKMHERFETWYRSLSPSTEPMLQTVDTLKVHGQMAKDRLIELGVAPTVCGGAVQ